MTGSELRRLRERLGLTQRAFAKQVGVHFVTVNRWEQGHMRISEPMARFIRLLAKPRGRRGGR